MNSAVELTDDTQLVAEAASGSSHAFAELFHRHYPQIHAFAYRLTLCPAEAADVAQDTFIQAAKSLGAFRCEASFKNWLYTIAHNKSRDRQREQTRRTRLSEQWASQHDPAQSTTHSPSPETEVVRAALQSLSPELRAAVTLVYYEGLTHAEASLVLNCAETTISWRLFRAKQKLKKRLRSLAAESRHD